MRQRGSLGRLGDPEVDHPRAVLGEQHIGWLQVTVNQAGTVNRVQPFREPGCQR